MEAGRAYAIRHTWKNVGVGKLPNENRNWRSKYRLSFALLSDRDSGVPVCRTLADAEPGEWLLGSEYAYESRFACGDIPAGGYDLAVALVNTDRGDEPEIALAMEGELPDRKWYKIGRVNVVNEKGGEANG